MPSDQLTFGLPAPPPRLPSDLRPMLVRAAPEPFDDPDWLFDPWWDGLRVLVFVEAGRVRIVDARGRDVGAVFPEMATLAEAVQGAPAVLDGELVVPSPAGRPTRPPCDGG